MLVIEIIWFLLFSHVVKTNYSLYRFQGSGVSMYKSLYHSLLAPVFRLLSVELRPCLVGLWLCWWSVICGLVRAQCLTDGNEDVRTLYSKNTTEGEDLQPVLSLTHWHWSVDLLRPFEHTHHCGLQESDNKHWQRIQTPSPVRLTCWCSGPQQWAGRLGRQ